MVRRRRSLLPAPLVVVLLGGVGACLSALDVDPPPPDLAVDPPRGRTQRLSDLEARADREPGRADRQLEAGMALARATLRGELGYQARAEHYLERAFRLDPHDPAAARVLGRFLNMRSSVLDLEHIDLQIEVYASLLHERDRPVRELTHDQFVVHCFLLAGRALRSVRDGRSLDALRWVRRLERDLESRTSAFPDEVDTFAMAGNYELTFAGVIPVGRDRRLRRAIEYFEVQQARWDELSPGARNRAIAPNTRTVFTFQLAEALLAAGETARARGYYRRVLALDDEPDSVPRRQLVAVSRERLSDLQRFAGRDELLPPWPSGVTGCVACHSRSAELPAAGLLVADAAVIARVDVGEGP